MIADTELRDSFYRPTHIDAGEWAARVQLAAAYGIFDRMGWTELIYNHISLRVPGDAGHILLNPFGLHLGLHYGLHFGLHLGLHLGLHYREVCASNLVKVDAQGGVVGQSEWPINPAGVSFHGALHRTLPDAHCVMPMHTTATQAFSLMWLVQRACEVQVATESMGAARTIATTVLDACVRDSLNFNPGFGAGQDVFDAMQRLQDAADPSYRR